LSFIFHKDKSFEANFKLWLQKTAFDTDKQIIIEDSLKTVDFGLKPGNCVITNCPVRQQAYGAIYVNDTQNFSHFKKLITPFYF